MYQTKHDYLHDYRDLVNFKTKNMKRQERTTGYNSTYKKLAVQWLNEALCFVSSSEVADSFRLRNRQLLVAAKRYRKGYKIPDYFNKDIDRNSINDKQELNAKENFPSIDNFFIRNYFFLKSTKFGSKSKF
jgi:hypothetical protein